MSRAWAILACVAVAGCGAAAPAAAPPFRHAAPAALLAREPDLGVACGRPNRFACDRIGVAVWLRRPAVRVTAWVNGRRVALDDPGWSAPARHGRRRMFAGFLHPAGLLHGPLRLTADYGPGRWIGRRPVFARVRLRVEDGRTATEVTVPRAQLAAGWG